MKHTLKDPITSAPRQAIDVHLVKVGFFTSSGKPLAFKRKAFLDFLMLSLNELSLYI